MARTLLHAVRQVAVPILPHALPRAAVPILHRAVRRVAAPIPLLQRPAGEEIAAVRRAAVMVEGTPAAVHEAVNPAAEESLPHPVREAILLLAATIVDLLAPVFSRHPPAVHRQEASQGASCN